MVAVLWMTLWNSSRAEELLPNHPRKVREKKRNLSPKKKIWESQKRSQKKPPHPTARRRGTSPRRRRYGRARRDPRRSPHPRRREEERRAVDKPHEIHLSN